MRGELQKTRRAEVADFEQALVGDEHVGGPQVPVDHALLVGVFDGIDDLARVVEREVQLERAAIRDDVLERLARHVLHDDEEDVVLLLCRDDRDDVGMVERGQQPRLAQQFAEVEALAVRYFDRDTLVDPGVLGQIDRTEPPAAQRFENAVLAERLPAKDHSAEVYRLTAMHFGRRAPTIVS